MTCHLMYDCLFNILDVHCKDLANRQDHSAVSSEGDWMPGPSASSTSRYDSQDAPSAIKQPLATTDLTTGITTWRIANPRGVAGTRLAATMEPMDNWFAPRKGLWIGSEDTSPSGDVTFMVNFDVSAPERAHFVLEYSVTDALKRAMLNGKLLDIGVSDGFKRLGGKMWIEAPAGQGLFGYGENVLMLTVSSRGKGPAAIYVCGRASVAIDLTTGLAPWRQPHDHGRFQRGSAPMTIPHGLWYSPRSGSWLGDSRNWPPEDTTFELSFDVEMPDLASFTLRYAVDHGLKSAHLNGKSLDVSGTGSYHQCGGDMVIRARQGEGLFVQGSNTLQVTVSNGGTRHNPMGLYATGRLEMLPLKAADVAAEKEDDPMTAELQVGSNKSSSWRRIRRG